jgi:hypothetical protein
MSKLITKILVFLTLYFIPPIAWTNERIKLILGDLAKKFIMRIHYFWRRYFSRDKCANKISKGISEFLNVDCTTWINLCQVGYSRVTKEWHSFFSIKADDEKIKKERKNFMICNINHVIIATSIFVIILFVSNLYLYLASLKYSENLRRICELAPSLTFIVFCSSVMLIRKIYEYTSLVLASMIKEKAERMDVFLDYAIDNEYYTEDGVKERFRDFLKIIGYKMPSERIGGEK